MVVFKNTEGLIIYWISDKNYSVLPARFLRSLTTDAASQLNILGHDGDTLSMDGAKIGIFEQANQVSFSSFLQSKDCRALEAKISLEILSNLANEVLEWQLADEKLF